MAGGIRIGPKAEEEMEEMVVVECEEEMNKTERGRLEPSTSILDPPMLHSQYSCPTSHPRLCGHVHVHHVRSEYACVSPPSLPVYVRRPTHAVCAPKGVATTRDDGPFPATADPTHWPNPAPPPVLAPRPSHSNEYPARQQQQGMGTFNDSRLTNMTCVRVPLQLPVVPGCVGVVSCIGDWECAHARPGCKCQYQLVWVLPSSVRCYALPLLRWLLQPSLKLPLLTTAPDSNNRPQVV